MSEAFKVNLKNGLHRIDEIEDLISITKEMYAKIGKHTHFGFELNPSSFCSYFSNPQRFKDCFCFGYFIDGKVVSYIIWIKIYDARVNKKIIQEYIWGSDPETKGYGIKLFKKSLEYIKNIYKFDIVLVADSEKNSKLEKFYIRNGFKLESKTFYKVT